MCVRERHTAAPCITGWLHLLTKTSLGHCGIQSCYTYAMLGAGGLILKGSDSQGKIVLLLTLNQLVTAACQCSYWRRFVVSCYSFLETLAHKSPWSKPFTAGSPKTSFVPDSGKFDLGIYIDLVKVHYSNNDVMPQAFWTQWLTEASHLATKHSFRNGSPKFKLCQTANN